MPGNFRRAAAFARSPSRDPEVDLHHPRKFVTCVSRIKGFRLTCLCMLEEPCAELLQSVSLRLLFCRCLFAWPLIGSWMPGLVGIETIHAFENLQRISDPRSFS
jgi:hypothetical protein